MKNFFYKHHKLKLVLIGYIISFFLFPVQVYAQTLSSDQSVIRSTPSNVKSLTNVNTPASENTQIQGINRSQIPSNMGVSGLVQTISIHVLGDVSSPGVYKVQVSDRAADVVKQASPARDNYRIIQIRHPGENNQNFDLYRYHYFGDLSQNPYLKDNDVIFVPKPAGTVKIEGSVVRPGIYELWGEKNLQQIVNLAGGFTSGMSKMYPVKVIRFSDGGEKFVLDVVQKTGSMKHFKIEKGDIIIVPDIINAAKKFDYKVETIPGEHHVYPTAIPDVFVIGAVSQSGPYPYKSHLTIKDYLGFAGATADANFRSVRVIRDGKKKRKSLYDTVQAGDVIIVKEKYMNEFMKYVALASTFMSVTLTALLLNDRLKNN